MKAHRVMREIILLIGLLFIFICYKCLSNNAPSKKKLWNILICTLEERKDLFNNIYTKIQNQIREHGLEQAVEILFFCDNREFSVGFKRNALIRSSEADYVCFVDDDDDVHLQYVAMIYEQLLKRPDCVRLVGIRTVNGERAQKFVHSIDYTTYFEADGIFYRPPNHLNPIKREYMVQFEFPDISQYEDTAQALALSESGVLKVEAYLDEPYYFYQYNENQH